MTRFENAPEYDSSPDWCYFDAPSNNHDRFAPDHTFTVDVAQTISCVTRIVSITKFNGSGTAERWLGVLEEELPEDLISATWLKRANA